MELSCHAAQGEKSMKKFIVLFTLIFCFTFTACGVSNSSAPGQSSSEPVYSSEDTSAAPDAGDNSAHAPAPASLDEAVINELIQYHLGNRYGSWADGKPTGINLYYGSDKIVEAPVTLRAPMDTSGYAFHVTKELTVIAFGCLETPEEPITILLSTDMGDFWNETAIDMGESQITYPYKQVYFQKDFGYLYCQNEDSILFYLTMDAGKTWQPTEPYDAGGKYAVTSGSFATPQTGFLCGHQDREPLLLRTKDGGGSWDVVDFPLPHDLEYDSARFDAPVFSDQYGVLPVVLMYESASAEAVCFVTGDFGETWSYYEPMEWREG